MRVRVCAKVDEVKVEGSKWASPKELTCNTLSVRVGVTAIDFPRLFQRQVILRGYGPTSCRVSLEARYSNGHGEAGRSDRVGERQKPLRNHLRRLLPRTLVCWSVCPDLAERTRAVETSGGHCLGILGLHFSRARKQTLTRRKAVCFIPIRGWGHQWSPR